MSQHDIDTMYWAKAHTNNLPLALVPIMHNPKTEGSNISFMFRSNKLLGEWICFIVISRNLANLHISFLDNLSNEMVLLKYMLGSLM